MIRRDILEQAILLTAGDRNEKHGNPYDNHQRIATIWSVILKQDITAAQVALCMAGMKLARLAYNPDLHDSYVDGAAYLAIAAECHVQDL